LQKVGRGVNMGEKLLSRGREGLEKIGKICSSGAGGGGRGIPLFPLPLQEEKGKEGKKQWKHQKCRGGGMGTGVCC